jgi:hypothetical protein
MAVDLTFHLDQRLARVTLSGSIDAAALAAAIELLTSDPRWSSSLNLIWDIRAATVTLSGEQLRQMIATRQARATSSRSRRTAVVVSSPLTYGMSRMAEIYLEVASFPTDFQIFHTIEEARAWIAAAPTSPRNDVAA